MVLMEPFYLMFYHNGEGNVRYFSVGEGLGRASNEILEMLINQLSRDNEDELRLRLRMKQQLRMNKEKSGELKKKRKKMNQQINLLSTKDGIHSESIFLSLVLF